jgi:hypothetical protein
VRRDDPPREDEEAELPMVEREYYYTRRTRPQDEFKPLHEYPLPPSSREECDALYTQAQTAHTQASQLPDESPDKADLLQTALRLSQTACRMERSLIRHGEEEEEQGGEREERGRERAYVRPVVQVSSRGDRLVMYL